MRKISAPKWFLVGVDARWSKFDHIFPTQHAGTEGSCAVTACGVDPYEHARNQATVRFAEPDGFTAQCPGCLAWQEGSL